MEPAVLFAALVGLDWSDQKHDLCLVDATTGDRELSIIKHTPEALNEWARDLRVRFGGRRVAVCMEQSPGSLIYALMKYDFLVLYPVNPQTLAKFREAFTPSRAKSDPTDAEFLVELLSHHRERLKAWTTRLGADAHAATPRRTPSPLGGRSDQNQQSVDGTPERLLPARLAMVSQHQDEYGVWVSAQMVVARCTQGRAAPDVREVFS